MTRRLLFLPILAIAAGAFALLTALGPEPSAREGELLPAAVRVETVRLAPRRATVSAHGVVRPARRTILAAEVAGRITWAAPGLRNGARVDSGALLFRIEPVAHELRVAQAESALAEAEWRAAAERAAGRAARAEWAEEEGEAPDPLALREPQLAAAEAALRAARAALRNAERDLERTEVRAPRAGLVAARSAEVGEWAAPGRALLELLSIGAAEVRVALPDAAAGLLDLPFGNAPAAPAPRARVIASFGPPAAPTSWIWEGRLTRLESEMDPATRFLSAIVEVPEPYRAAPDGRPPLLAGAAVEVRIEGREVPGVAVVRETAFRQDGTLLVVDAGDRIRIRSVDAFWTTPDGEVLVRSGLAAGDRVVTTPPTVVTDGMRVLPEPADAPLGAAPPAR